MTKVNDFNSGEIIFMISLIEYKRTTHIEEKYQPI